MTDFDIGQLFAYIKDPFLERVEQKHNQLSTEFLNKPENRSQII